MTCAGPLQGEDDDKGHLITRRGDRVLTSVTQHLAFVNSRKKAAGRGYAELIRLLEAWVREGKRTDEDCGARAFCSSCSSPTCGPGWNGQALQVNDYPLALEQVLSYITRTGLREPLCFGDFYDLSEVQGSTDPIQV